MDPEMRDDEVTGLTGLGLRGRRMARAMLVLAVVPFVVVAFLVFAAPATMGPQPSLFDFWPAWLGIVIAVVGLVWMIRIYRADPEAHPSFWRSRRF